MSELVNTAAPVLLKKYRWYLLSVAGIAVAALLWPQDSLLTAEFVVEGMLEVSYLVIPGILVSAWVNASGMGGQIRKAFERGQASAILIASIVGAITPVCGVTVLPLMAGLLAAGVPLAPVMAFWLSSPVTDPAMFSVTAATLGFHFAIAKTLAAFLLGLFGGAVVAAIAGRPWIRQSLREKGLAAKLGQQVHCSPGEIRYAIWKEPARLRQFGGELWAMTRLIVICLGFAFAAEYQMQVHLHPETFAGYLGEQSAWAVPLAVLVGSPAYLDGYAALPLTRGLIDHGMSPGAAMAFLVSGSVVSIWGAIAIFPVLRSKPFLLYLLLALTGSLAVGWLYDGLT